MDAEEQLVTAHADAPVLISSCYGGAALPEANAQDTSEYVVVLDRSDGSTRLGVGVSRDIDGQAVLIKSIQEEDQLVGKWNGANPGRRVRVGDSIVEVNGISGNASQIDAELQKAQELKLKLRRQREAVHGATPSQQQELPPPQESHHKVRSAAAEVMLTLSIMAESNKKASASQDAVCWATSPGAATICHPHPAHAGDAQPKDIFANLMRLQPSACIARGVRQLERRTACGQEALPTFAASIATNAGATPKGRLNCALARMTAACESSRLTFTKRKEERVTAADAERQVSELRSRCHYWQKKCEELSQEVDLLKQADVEDAGVKRSKDLDICSQCSTSVPASSTYSGDCGSPR